MDDISKLIKIIGELTAQNADLQRQVDMLAKQGMKKSRAMRQANKALSEVQINKTDDGTIPDHNGRIVTICKMAQIKLDSATIGSL